MSMKRVAYPFLLSRGEASLVLPGTWTKADVQKLRRAMATLCELLDLQAVEYVKYPIKADPEADEL